MSAPSSPAPAPLPAANDPNRLKVGTLQYTKAGLITLFLFLLWGDFCFTLMETVVPSILPLKLNSIGAPNWALGLIVTKLNPDPAFCYRFLPVWNFTFQTGGFLFTYLLYREWKKLGGKDNFVPPAPLPNSPVMVP